MGVHLLVAAVAKFPFMHFFRFSPLLLPFNLYLPLVRHLPRVFNVISTASSLLVFRLQQILTVRRHRDPRGRSRWERLLLLVTRELRLTDRLSSMDETSLQMLISVYL